MFRFRIKRQVNMDYFKFRIGSFDCLALDGGGRQGEPEGFFVNVDKEILREALKGNPGGPDTGPPWRSLEI